MKSKLLRLAALIFGFLLIATPVIAHHSFMGEYDLSKAVTLTGTVTKVEWANPHISFQIDVRDVFGKTIQWTFESASPTSLVRRGWTPTSLKAGQTITVEAFLARKGRPFAAAQKVTFSDGRSLSANSDGVRPPT